ncbi:hypothetical protein CYD30_25430 [Kosakonia cowanii]|nr:hypothetical protein CYD30_25430 [Kosakonia cowanii]
MRLTPEDFARPLPGIARYLSREALKPPDIPVPDPPERVKNRPSGSFTVGVFSYPQITAREVSIRLQPLCL